MQEVDVSVLGKLFMLSAFAWRKGEIWMSLSGASQDFAAATYFVRLNHCRLEFSHSKA
jgi:hypothetical protein